MGDWFEVTDKAHIQKERIKAQELKDSQWWKNLKGKGICHYCQAKFPPQELTMDHIVPVARGGTSSKGNVVPSCKKCNQEKKLKTPVDEILDKLKDSKESQED